MGIDVYLEWDGQTEEEKAAQLFGHGIRQGNIGYLHAAFNSDMKEEVKILDALFPGREGEEADPYDFLENTKKILDLLVPYFIGTAKEEVRIAWGMSILQFFRLGSNLQLENKNPRVFKV